MKTVEEYAILLVRLTQFSTLIPIIFGIYTRFKGVRLAYLTPLLILLVAFIPLEIINSFLASRGNNLAFTNFLRIFSTLFYLLVFYRYSEGQFFRKVIVVTFSILFVLNVTEILFSPWNLHFQFSNLAQNLALAIVSFSTLLNMKVVEETSVINHPIFWYGIAIFFYNSTSVVIQFAQNYFIKLEMNHELYIVSMIGLLILVCQYFLFSVAFYKQINFHKFG